MSISSEIARLSSNVSAAKVAIATKGVEVPESAKSDDLAALIYKIQIHVENMAVIEFSWDGTTGHSSKTYSEIKQLVDDEKQSILGNFILGQSVLGVLMFVFGVVDIEGQTSQYCTQGFMATLYELDDTNKKAWFVVSPTLTFSIDEFGVVDKRETFIPVVDYDTDTHVLSLS